MRDQLEKRLEELRGEHESGRKLLAEQKARVASLEASMLRISGAIQVLEESLGEGAVSEDEPAVLSEVS